jgi:hypothetical protein
MMTIHQGIISDDVAKNDKAGILLFDFKAKTFQEIRTNKDIDAQYLLSVYNDYATTPECSCGK